jgi:hypothetical protein
LATQKVEATFRERRRTPVADETFAKLAKHSGFWALVEAGVLAPRLKGRREVEIETTGWVGEASFGDVRLTVHPHFEGTLEALLAEVTRLKSVPVPSQRSDSGLDEELISAFVTLGLDYVAARRPPRFTYTRESGALPHGALQLPETLRFWAQGRRPRTEYLRGEVIQSGPLDEVLRAGCSAVERHAPNLPRGLLVRNRRMVAALEAPRALSAVSMQGTALEHARSLATDWRLGESDRSLAAIAALVIANRTVGFEATSEQMVSSGFVDLAAVFELAVRSVFTRLEAGVQVRSGADHARPLFTRVDRAGIVNPDLVLEGEDGVFAVGDVKYKDSQAARSDIYQLLVHTAAFTGPAGRSPAAFLIQLGESYRAQWCGDAVTGAATWSFAVSPLALERDLARVLKVLSPMAKV